MSDAMPMSEARRYQQMRGHLSYLKLNDAAEALPRVLDQARAERMTLTTTLEKLLEIEVEATEARKLSSRLRSTNSDTSRYRATAPRPSSR
ncbi:hypothetical protein [Streptomyces sp. NPDC056632]|uniref:hypothetical protein n=1 Tax=Streptomyces sp. NPDC056632 TaxID=3345884 RepID=UPI003688993A